MKIITLLLASWFSVPVLAASAQPAQSSQPSVRPNIVFILTDDQRWDSLSCAGHPFLKTPNIDRLAREGAMFQNAFVTTPLCSPSRASLLTGEYTHTHKVYGNGNSNALSHELKTWPAMLQQAGYETAWIGKIHMGGDATPRPGFDHWISFQGQGIYRDPIFNIDGKPTKTTGYITDLLNGYAVDFLRKPHEKPFVMFLAHKAVHQPFVPADRHKDLYADDPLPRRPNTTDTLEGKPVLQRKPLRTGSTTRPGVETAVIGQTASGPTTRPRADESRPSRAARDMLRCIASVDDGVGEILKTLEQTGQLDNTLVIFTSDNGYLWGEHKLGDKRAAYEESIRVPLLMRYPKLISAGSKPNEIALNVDIAPTALELAGVPIPAQMHGKSLVSVLENKPGKSREAALLEYFDEPKYPLIPSWQAVRTDRWKYIHYTDLPGMDELYDLQADPYEMKNLIAEDSAKATLDKLKTQLDKLLDESK